MENYQGGYGSAQENAGVAPLDTQPLMSVVEQPQRGQRAALA